MQLPAKLHYAVVALIELAVQQRSDQPVAVRSIAELHGIPLPFLVQILQQLKSSGMVSSVRGASGGYRLERSPDEISLSEVIDSVCPTNTTMQASDPGSSSANRVTQQIWERLEAVKHDFLADIKISHLVEQLQPASSGMFYI